MRTSRAAHNTRPGAVVCHSVLTETEQPARVVITASQRMNETLALTRCQTVRSVGPGNSKHRPQFAPREFALRESP